MSHRHVSRRRAAVVIGVALVVMSLSLHLIIHHQYATAATGGVGGSDDDADAAPNPNPTTVDNHSPSPRVLSDGPTMKGRGIVLAVIMKDIDPNVWNKNHSHSVQHLRRRANLFTKTYMSDVVEVLHRMADAVSAMRFTPHAHDDAKIEAEMISLQLRTMWLSSYAVSSSSSSSPSAVKGLAWGYDDDNVEVGDIPMNDSRNGNGAPTSPPPSLHVVALFRDDGVHHGDVASSHRCEFFVWLWSGRDKNYTRQSDSGRDAEGIHPHALRLLPSVRISHPSLRLEACTSHNFQHVKRSTYPPSAPPLTAEATTSSIATPMDIVLIVLDSVSHASFQRSAAELGSWLDDFRSSESSSHRRFSFRNSRVAGCCTPSNLSPMLSGAVSSESPSCIRSEPPPSSPLWLWNLFRRSSGGGSDGGNASHASYFGTDVCPDHTSRPFQSTPTTDAHFVGPTCIGGFTLSNSHVPRFSDGSNMAHHLAASFETFWMQHAQSRRLAFLYIAGTHEPSESVLRDVDKALDHVLRRLHGAGALDHAAVVLLSDHGVGFGEYAGLAEGWLEQSRPLFELILPSRIASLPVPAAFQRSIVTRNKTWADVLQFNADKVVTPMDFNLLLRVLILHRTAAFEKGSPGRYLPFATASYRRSDGRCGDPPVTVPHLPLWIPLQANRSCRAANIPHEWCHVDTAHVTWEQPSTAFYRAVALRAYHVHKSIYERIEPRTRLELCLPVSTIEPLFVAVRRMYSPAIAMIVVSYKTLPGNRTFRLTWRGYHESKSADSVAQLRVVRLIRISTLGDGCGGRLSGLFQHVCECR